MMMNMKKVLLMAVVATMATNASAQQGYDDTKHEVAISMGAVSNSQWLDIFEEVTSTVFTVGYVTFENEKFTGPFSAEYFYHANKWLGVGGIFVFGQSKQDVLVSKDLNGEAVNTYYSLLPAAKLDWLRKKHFGMYSKAAIGATLRHESVDYDTPTKEEYSHSAIHLNWQVSLLGIEAGSPRVRGFVELGVGEQGIAQIGMRYKF